MISPQVGSKIASLEGRKRAAVEAEDYDLAKELKAEIDRVRARAYAAALSGESSAGDVGGAGSVGITGRRGGSTAGAAPVESSSVSAAVAAQQETHWGSLQQQSSGSKAMAAAPPAAPAVGGPPAASDIDWSKYDDRPAVAKGTYDFAGADASTPPPGSRHGSAAGESISAPAAVDFLRAPVSGPPPPAGFPSDLPPPDELSPADAAAAAPAEALLGEYLARCLFSRAWQLREAVLVRAAADVASTGSELAGRMDSDPGETFHALARLVARGLADKAVGVYAAALGLLHAAVNAAALRASELGSAGPSAVGELLPLLVEKGADLNGRIREQACEVRSMLALQRLINALLATFPHATLFRCDPAQALNHLLGVRELGVRKQVR